ncbi:MAG: hypothetical protein EXR72_10695 [Myxococcales bacterium]|nr:hypothetical protein [Myxococcales bacterium]
MSSCAHGGTDPSTCDRCRRAEADAQHIPLPDGVTQILRALVEAAGDGGPHAPGGSRNRVQAAVVVDAIGKGEPWFALKALAHLDETDPRWRRLGDAVRIFAGVSIACRLAVRGEVAQALRVLDRIVARMR